MIERAMSRRERIALAAIVVGALVVRLAFIVGQRSDVLFDMPQLDEQRYVHEARALVDGQPSEQDRLPYWQPPGVTYVLYATFRVAGPGLLTPRLVAAVASAASCLLLFALARRLFGVRVGLAATTILALHGVVVFETYQLLPATYALFFDLAAILLLVVAAGRDDAWGPRVALAAGVALGVSALFVATVLPFALVGAIALRRRPLAVAAFVVGVMLPIAPVTVRNWVRAGEPVLISANAGLNFYIGNNANYRDTFTTRPGRHWMELVEEPRRERAASPGTAGASRYFFTKGLGFYRDDPADAAALLLRKLYLSLQGAEIARDSDVYAVREDSTLLSVLVWRGPVSLPNGLLVPLALVGIVALWPERRRLFVPLGFLAVQLFFVSLFFVSARYRVPSVPMFALLAAAGLPRLVQRLAALRTPTLRATAIATAASVVALIVACNLPTWETRFSLAAEREMFRGLAFHARGELPHAVAAFQRATQLDASDARSWFELGNSYDAIGRLPEAVEAWRRAADLDPWDSRPRRREAVGRSRMGDIDGAIRTLETLIAAGARAPAHYAPDHLNLAFTLARRGEQARAIEHLRAASADPDYLRNALPRMAGELLASDASPALFRQLAEVSRVANLPELAAAAEGRASELERR
jgi:tetratricopeptide (TPR) repeat protein